MTKTMAAVATPFSSSSRDTSLLLSQIGNTSWKNNWSTTTTTTTTTTIAITIDDTKNENIETNNNNYYCEIREKHTGNVWICLQPMTIPEYDALLLSSKKKNWEKVGLGRSPAHLTYFRGSPTTPLLQPKRSSTTTRATQEEGPMQTTEIDGRIFSFCAHPFHYDVLGCGLGAMSMLVNKQHTVLFQAGSTIDIVIDQKGNQFVTAGTDLYDFGPKGIIVSLIKMILSTLEWIIKILQPHRVVTISSSSSSSSSLALLLPLGWSIRQVTLEKHLVLEIPNPATVYYFYLSNILFHGPLDPISLLQLVDDDETDSKNKKKHS